MDVLSRAQAKKMVKRVPKKAFKKITRVLKRAKKTIKRVIKRKAKLPNSKVVKLTQVNSKLDLDIWNYKQVLGNKMVQWTAHGGNNQKFRLIYVTKNKFRISAFNKSYLTFGRQGNEVKLQRWNPRNKSQIFHYYAAKKAFINDEGKCLDMWAWSKARGQRIVLWRCHYGKNQQWIIKPLGGKKVKVAVRAKKVKRKAYKRVIRKQKKVGRNFYTYIGNSGRNTKCSRIASNVKLVCPKTCLKNNCRVNPDYRTANDSFKLTWTAGRLCAKRLHTRAGWGMRLKVRCKAFTRVVKRVLKKKKKVVGRNTFVYIGNSGGNTRCVNRSKTERLVCPSTCLKNNCRVNPDYRTANDKFRLSWTRGRLCAKRLDSRGGWGMRLKVRCRSYYLGGKVSRSVSKRVVQLRNVRSNKNIDVWRGQIKTNQKEVIWYAHNGTNQKFRVNRRPGGRFQLEAYNNSNLVLGQTGGYVVKLVRKNYRDPGQILRYYGPKKAIINNRGRCLDVAGGRSNAGTGLYFWSCHWATNQQFRMLTTK